MKWFWEPRGNAEFTPPQIATLLQGWVDPKADLKSPIPQESEVFVREVVQNFVDASREEQSRNPQVGKPTLTFRFVDLVGEAAADFADKVNLSSISDRYASFGQDARKDMRLSASDTVTGNHDRIRLLVLTETNTCGMFGQWDRSDQEYDSKGNEIVSRMRDALLASVRGSAGKGLGAFGEGKKAVIGISAPRTLFAYTCFDPQTSTDNVSRRFMGGVYWQNHTFANKKYSGFAMIGDDIPVGDVRPVPFVDEAADERIRQLGIPGLDVRSANNGRGTTYLFIDHITTPQEVAQAVARNWWPLIVDGGAEFTVIRADGSEEPIVFDQVLQPFLTAYAADSSRIIEDWVSVDEGEVATHVERLTASAGGFPLGDLKLAIDLRPVVGWSRKDPETNTSIVALVRDGMIISYQQFPKSKKMAAPFIRGVFSVTAAKHPKSEDLLRSVEPPLHNKWQDENRELDLDARKAAKDVYSKIMDAVRDFRESYVSSTPTDEQDFRIFRENLSLSGSKRVVAPPATKPKANTPWSMLSASARVIDNNDGRRFAEASRTLQLAKPGTREHYVKVQVGWEILEDNSWVEVDQSLLATPVLAQEGWEQEQGEHNVFIGRVKDQPATFKWVSRPYRELWTLRPYMKVTSLEAQDEAEVAE
jgi:hypothetical protein